MQLAEIINTIEKIAPLRGAAAWDLSGLQVAAHRQDIAALALCLDPAPQVVARALELGAQCILSHHPLLLKPVLPRRLDNYHEVLRLLLTADVPLYAAHTSLDVNSDGPSGWLARELGLSRLSVLEVAGEPLPEASLPLGYGLAGDLPEPLSFTALCDKLAHLIDLGTARVSGSVPQSIKRVAYCTGSGSSLWAEACKAGADILITGDVKHHTALDSEICLLDVEHHSLEEEMMRRFCPVLAAAFPEMRVFFVASPAPFRSLATI